MSEMDPDVVLGDVDPNPGLEPTLEIETPEADALEQAQVVGADDDEDEHR